MEFEKRGGEPKARRGEFANGSPKVSPTSQSVGFGVAKICQV